MFAPTYPRMMARYNQWQNRSLIVAADGLDDAARRRERGAFFGSIHATFCHLLWADMIWWHRLAGMEKPPGNPASSIHLEPDWARFKSRRAAMDEAIITWADGLPDEEISGDFHWVSTAGRASSHPKGLIIAHVFNHQTHHRGQIHAMLTAEGAKPEDTDLILMPTA